jgi:hypothetical protein
MSQKTNPKPAIGARKQEASRKDEGLKARVSTSHPGELSDAELETVTGGKAAAKGFLMKSCATGKHLKEGTITL